MPFKGTRTTVPDNSLEGYIGYHFDENFLFNFNFPTTTYKERVNDNTVRFAGYLQSQVNLKTNFNLIPRWSTFKELAKGCGFNFKLEVTNPATAYNLQTPNFTLKQIFIEDLANETPIGIEELPALPQNQWSTMRNTGYKLRTIIIWSTEKYNYNTVCGRNS